MFLLHDVPPSFILSWTRVRRVPLARSETSLLRLTCWTLLGDASYAWTYTPFGIRRFNILDSCSEGASCSFRNAPLTAYVLTQMSFFISSSCSIVPMLTVDDVVAFTWVAKPSVGSNSSSQSKSDQSDQYFQLK